MNKSEGWLKVRRGLVHHWPDMTDGESILFMTYLFYAQYRGKKKGWCGLADLDVCSILAWTRNKMLYAKKQLIKRGFIKTTPGHPGVLIPKYDK